MTVRGTMTLALLAGTLALPAAGRAQDAPQWGVKGGLNLSSLRGSHGLIDGKRGVAGGGFLIYPLSPEFSLEADALFTMKGGKLEGPGPEIFYILDYIEVPVLARFDVPLEGEVRPHVYFGPTLGIKLSARARTAGIDQNLSAAKTLDSGLAFGASADFLAGTHRLVVDARYGFGLTNAVSLFGFYLKNDVFSLMAGVAF